MSGTSIVPYNPNDPVQQGFLQGIRSGESAPGYGGYFQGTGQAPGSLQNAATDQYGFPQWSGTGNSHAAGAYQFQPGTWTSVASQYGLNFQNTQDQDAAAWYLGQQAYQSNTGQSLYGALQQGNYSSVGSSLSPTWTSVSGNTNFAPGSNTAYAPYAGTSTDAATQQAYDPSAFTSTNDSGYSDPTGSGAVPTNTAFLPPGTGGSGDTIGLPNTVGALNQQAASAPGSGQQSQVSLNPSLSGSVSNWISGLEKTVTGAATGFLSGILTEIENLALRSFLIVIGAVVLFVAIWKLLDGGNAYRRVFK